MKKIKILNVVFNKELSKSEVPAFRGAVLNLLGDADVIFHNHSDDEKFVYDYPRIQYKVIGKKAALFCLEEGVEKIYSFFNLRNRDIIINGVKSDLVIEQIKANEHLIQAWDKYFNYSISSWLALNEINYAKYRTLDNEDEKIFFLENILRGNILSFGKGLNCMFDREVKVQITVLTKEFTSNFKGVKMHTINAEFRTNVSLPAYLGLGKGVSIGYGIVKTKRNEINQ
ncbi:MAG: CRISPR-associated endonuclease Cas6 [Lutibacter sp.]|nr:CRISPR-associated endonuclease Cas6 [Lutibacter sp.]